MNVKVHSFHMLGTWELCETMGNTFGNGWEFWHMGD